MASILPYNSCTTIMREGQAWRVEKKEKTLLRKRIRAIGIRQACVQRCMGCIEDVHATRFHDFPRLNARRAILFTETNDARPRETESNSSEWQSPSGLRTSFARPSKRDESSREKFLVARDLCRTLSNCFRHDRLFLPRIFLSRVFDIPNVPTIDRRYVNFWTEIICLKVSF